MKALTSKEAMEALLRGERLMRIDWYNKENIRYIKIGEDGNIINNNGYFCEYESYRDYIIYKQTYSFKEAIERSLSDRKSYARKSDREKCGIEIDYDIMASCVIVINCTSDDLNATDFIEVE
jgi:hypothetical protein